MEKIKFVVASHHNLQYILTSYADVPLHPLRKVLNIAIIIHTPNTIFTTMDDYEYIHTWEEEGFKVSTVHLYSKLCAVDEPTGNMINA